MSESLYRGIQFGVESTYGTGVAATTIFPVDEGSLEFQTNRGTRFAEEDFGTQVAFLAGRGGQGVRMASGSLSADARFEDLGQLLRIALSDVAYTGAGPYTQTFTAGATTDTTKSASIQINSDVQDFLASGCKINSLSIGFDAIGAGANSPWKVTADFVSNRVVKGSATGSLTIPSVLETMEGHLTQIYEGTTATAYASLAELAGSLVQYHLKVDQDRPLRPYGGTTDYATSVGIRKRRTTFTAMLALSSSSITDVYDIFDAAGGLLSERRWRIKVSGSGAKTMTIDHRVAFTNVVPDPSGRDGEYLLSVEGDATYDSTLASDIVVAIAGVANATLP